MLRKINKHIAVFLLLLFLFPLTEKQLHALNHADDRHCTASDKHFHAAEHNCSICDYNFTDSNPAASAGFTFVDFGSVSVRLPFSESVYTPSAFCILPSRAPPVI